MPKSTWSVALLFACLPACLADPELAPEEEARVAAVTPPPPALPSATAAAPGAPAVQTVTATQTGRQAFTLSAGKTYTFFTSAPQPTTGLGDTVLYLIRKGGTAQVAWNDDEAVGVRTSRLTYTVPAGASATYEVFVVAKQNLGAGKVTLTQLDTFGGTIWSGTTSFGGAEVAVPTSSGLPLQHDTVLAPGGAADPILFGLDGNRRLVAWDDNGGVGAGDRIASSQITAVVVGTSGSSTGAVRLLSNDVASADADGDGLGTKLEEALGSCDRRPATGPCAAVVNLRDSDRDGLEDAAEAMGLDTAPPQYLPRWGADPRRKDVFVEADWYTPTYASQPITEAIAMAMRAAFAAAPAADARNLDGSAGIQLHLDLGYAPAQAGNVTLFGSWGGATAVSATDPNVNRATIRKGVFVHGLIGGGGSGSDGWFSASLDWGSTPLGQVQTVLHELGHALGLEHEGFQRYEWGLNCNPMYTSTMSYAASMWGAVGYSDGSAYAGFTLNPSSLCETQGLGGGSLAHVLDSYRVNTFGTGVDWNNDGVYSDCAHRVRAAVNWNVYQGCDAQDDGSSDVAAGIRPALVYLDGFTYVFYARAGSIYYVRAAMSPDLAATAGCPTGFDRAIGTTCSTWSAEERLALPVADATLGSALVVGAEIHLAFIGDGGVRTVALANTDSTGRIMGWSPIESVAGAQPIRGPELAMVQVDPARFGGRTRLEMAVWPSAAPVTNLELRWSYRLAGGGYAAERGVLDVNGQPIWTGVVPPTLLTWGDVLTPGASQTLLAVSDLAHHVRVYSYEPATDRWRDRTAQVFASPPTDLVSTKIALAFHPLLDAGGVRLAAHKGDVYLAYKDNDHATSGGHLWISNVIDPAHPPATSLVFGNRNGVYGHGWLELDGTYGDLELYTDPDFPFLKGVMVKPGAAGQPTRIVVNPFADGVSDIDFRNGSDFRVMERGICLGLRDNDVAACGGPNAWGY